MVLLISIVISACDNEVEQKAEPLFQEQWAIHYNKAFYDAYNINPDAHIHAESVFAEFTGKGIKIAVIDGGLDKFHPELKNSLARVINSRDDSGNVSCENPLECYHGTAVTGIIAAAINGLGLRGLAPDASITFIGLDLNGFVSDSEIVDALEYAEQAQVDIVNCSWGTGDVSPIVKQKIDYLAEFGRDGKGMIFVFANGNQDIFLENDESMLDSVSGIGSSDEENLRAVYSNYGEGLDLLAPGGYLLGITTTYHSNDVQRSSDYLRAEDYLKFQGSSAAAPIVTAAIALLLEAEPTLTRIQVQQLLRHSADKIGYLDYYNGHNNYYGFGKINLQRAFSQAAVIFPAFGL